MSASQETDTVEILKLSVLRRQSEGVTRFALTHETVTRLPALGKRVKPALTVPLLTRLK
jgi:hypothetical protein